MFQGLFFSTYWPASPEDSDLIFGFDEGQKECEEEKRVESEQTQEPLEEVRPKEHVVGKQRQKTKECQHMQMIDDSINSMNQHFWDKTPDTISGQKECEEEKRVESEQTQEPLEEVRPKEHVVGK